MHARLKGNGNPPYVAATNSIKMRLCCTERMNDTCQCHYPYKALLTVVRAQSNCHSSHLCRPTMFIYSIKITVREQ